MEDIEKNFISFLEGIPNIIKEIEDKKPQPLPKFNIVDCIGELYDEVKNSQIIKNVLKIKFTHDNKEISFAKLFIDYINENHLRKNNKIKYSSNNIKVKTEVSTDDRRRIDILMIIDDNDIIIENKIYASDGDSQLNAYYEDRKNKNKNVYVLYLTRYASDVTEYSLSEDNRNELGEKFICISHGDIAIWLKNILENNVSFMKTDDKYKFIYSALVQIIENQKILSAISEEDNVEKEVIGNYVEKFIKDKNIIKNKDIISAKKYAEVLKQASDAFYYRFYYDFYSKLLDALNEKFKGISAQTKYEDELSNDELDNIVQKVFIKREKKNKYIKRVKYVIQDKICISLQIYTDKGETEKRVYGIRDGDGNQREKDYVDRLDKLKDNIKDLGYNKSSDWWSHYNEIDEEKNDPEVIADRMYNLYKLLKDNGF